MNNTLRGVGVGLWLFALVFVTSYLVNIGIEQSALILGAPFLTLLPIGGLVWLKPKEEVLGWSLFTIWLSLTYLSSGVPAEYAASLVIVALAIFGGLYKPMLLPIVWFSHVIFDFLPRDLPVYLEDLPVACLIFDGFIGLYLTWRIKKLKADLPPMSPFSRTVSSQVDN